MTMTPVADPTSAKQADTTGKPMRKIWIDGEFVDQANASISVFDHGFLYGDGCFEGIRSYSGRVFKLASHLRRLYESAEKLRLKPKYPIEQIDAAVRETLNVNELKDAYIRLVFSRGVGNLGLNPFQCPESGTVIIADSIELYPKALYDTGLKVIVADRPRIPIQCLDPAIKSLNYLNNILAKIEAIDAGVLEAIMLNTEGYVSECTGDNLFFVKDGRVFTPPTSAGMLHGITRQFVLDTVAPACGYEVSQEMVRIESILEADEVFLTGTAAEIIGVNQVDETVIGDGTVGPITKEFNAEFRRQVAQDGPED